MSQAPPNNLDAERAVLGAMLLSERAVEDVTALIDAADFYRPQHATIYAALVTAYRKGRPTDPITIAHDLTVSGDLERVGGGPYLHTCVGQVPTVANAGYYAGIVAEAARLRAAQVDVVRLGQVVERGDLAAIATVRAELIDSWSTRAAPRDDIAGQELDAFLGDEPPKYEWLVPGLLERGDRLILTGQEGGGKSTLLRQLGVQFASGIHPFGGDGYEPLRVLLIDLENSRRQVHRKLNPIRLAAGNGYAGGMFVEVRTEGLDLLQREDGDWLLALADRHQPDILITGPAYKMAGGDPTEEGPARTVSMYLDRLRADYECALLLEAHSPHASNGGKRPERPYGASLWLRWPEFGLYLSPEGHLRHWRGARDEREWPAALQRGGEWPWTVVARERDLVWARIVELCREAGDQLSRRDLAKLTGASVTSVGRAIDEHPEEWKALDGEAGR